MSIIVFTDGGCWGNGKKDPIAGIGIHFPNKEFKDVSIPFTKNPITNQRAELYAIYLTLRSLYKKNIIQNTKVKIYTDSMYSINCTTKWYKKWKKNNWQNSKGESVANQEFIKAIVKFIEVFDVELIHVPSHSGKKDYKSVHNEEADKLATAAIIKQKGGSDKSNDNKNKYYSKNVKVVLLQD